MVGTKQVHGGNGGAGFAERYASLPGGPCLLTMYWPRSTARPQIRASHSRDARPPQSGFSMLIRLISARGGLLDSGALPRGSDFHRQ